jgi:MoaA/NifB/PqqE/SkfB family radical SAM enzyme
MQLTGLHLLLTHQCLLECEHCFVFGSPNQNGTMTGRTVEHILAQARELGSVEWIYFEGGEPVLYYPLLLKGVSRAARDGFQVGVVTNGYWANSLEDAREALRPFAGIVQDLSISSDRFHWDEPASKCECALAAAAELGIPAGLISIAGLEELNACLSLGKISEGESEVMFRGRAAVKLAERAPQYPWSDFTKCPHEDLQEPDRLHIDPFGNLHICQGIVIGNIFESSLREITTGYVPAAHPICGPLLSGGPARLVGEYSLPYQETYAGACHLCYESRLALRSRFPEYLGPDQVYGAY